MALKTNQDYDVNAQSDINVKHKNVNHKELFSLVMKVQYTQTSTYNIH